MLHTWASAEAPANQAVDDDCRLLQVAKGQEAVTSSACEKKRSPAEPSEMLVNRLHYLSMNLLFSEFITVSSGLVTQEESGSRHISRREGAWVVVGEPVPTPIPCGHRVLLGTMLGCILTAPGNGVWAIGVGREPEWWAAAHAGVRWGDGKGMDHWNLFSIRMPLKLMHGSALGACPAPSCGADPTNALNAFTHWFFF